MTKLKSKKIKVRALPKKSSNFVEANIFKFTNG
jgi:hypothetical protein